MLLLRYKPGKKAAVPATMPERSAGSGVTRRHKYGTRIPRPAAALISNRGALFILMSALIAASALSTHAGMDQEVHLPAGAVLHDTLSEDTLEEKAVVEDTLRGADSTHSGSAQATAPAVSDSALPVAGKNVFSAPGGVPGDTVRDSLDVFSNTVAGLGAGISLGSNPVFKLWQGGLPGSLADYGLTANFMAQPGDSSSLLLTIKEKPEMYNFTLPLAVSFSRLTLKHRFGAAVAFSWLSKKYNSSVSIGADSLRRRIDIGQSLRLYTVFLDCVYGRTIPTRYFSVDGVGRTDVCIGLSAAPFLSIKKTTSIAGLSSDVRLSAAKDSIAKRINAFSSSGIACGGRAGIITERSLSKSGGLEVGCFYSLLWSTRFSADGASLTEGVVSPHNNSSKKISYFSHRIEITFTLVRAI